MSELYILDGNLPKTSNDVMKTYIQNISPRPPIDIIPTPKGTIVKFSYDQDCNFIYDQHTAIDLRMRHLTATLRQDTLMNRQIYIQNPTQQIYDAPPQSIALEIQHRYNFNVLNIEKFTSFKTKVKYITCILPSKEAASSFVAYGSITLFGHEMALQAKRFTKSVSSTRFPQQSHTSTTGTSRIFSHQIGPTALANQWSTNNSVTQQGNANSRTPYATHHTAPKIKTTANIYNNGNTTSAINPGMVTLTTQGGFVPPQQHFSTALQNTHSGTTSTFNLGMVPSKMQGGVVPPYQHFSTNTTTQSGTTTVPPQHGPPTT